MGIGGQVVKNHFKRSQAVGDVYLRWRTSRLYRSHAEAVYPAGISASSDDQDFKFMSLKGPWAAAALMERILSGRS